MALRRESMAVLMTLLSLLPLLFVPTTTTTAQQLRSDHHHQEGHISIYVSESGLDFVKDLLIEKALSSIIPLQLSDIEKKVKIPLVGSVHLALSNIQIYEADIPSSSSVVVDTAVEENGVVLDVSGATADLSMNWSYTYSALFVRISDHGTASVKVEDMNVRLTVSLIERNGSLTMSVLESDCYVKSLKIDIDGGASWLYQGVVDAFQKKITAAVENTISMKIKQKMEKLQSLLQSLPKEKKIDDFASINLTFTDEPILGDSSIEVEINGLFIPNDNASVSEHYLIRRSRPSFFFGGLKRMVKISLEDKVLNSAALVYFNAKRMQLVTDRTHNQSILNTSFWKLIFPELYRRYPDDEMKLNMSVISPPVVMITEKGIHAIIHLDTTVDVLDYGQVIPVACISSVLSASCSAEISENNLTGGLRLVDFNASMKWSEFGNPRPNYVQTAVSTILEAVFFPYVNARLKRGFPLPIPHGFSIEGMEILFKKSWVTVCSDINSYI